MRSGTAPANRTPFRTLGLLSAWLLILAGALFLRVPQLEVRPLHTDESVHTIRFKGLWETNTFAYNPDEYHGPSLYYATLPSAWATGGKDYADQSIRMFRMVPVLFGVGLILLLVLQSDGLGRQATLWAGLFTAVSTAMVFYSRYYIHEMLLVFATMLLLVGLWRYVQSRHWAWMVCAGVGLGLMHATKETFVFNLVALGIAALAMLIWDRRRKDGLLAGLRQVKKSHLAIGLGVTCGVSVLLFTAFFTHAEGPLDSLRTYLPWFRRAQGESPHIHPWSYYLEILAWKKYGTRLVWTEGLILLLAVIGCIRVFWRGPMPCGDLRWGRFIAVYTVALTLIYSVIPYKTPWCLLGFLHGMILLAGIGAAACVAWARRWPAQIVVALLILAGAGHLAAQARRASITYCDSQRNPYVYAHTLADVLELTDRIETLATLDPRGHDMMIQVIGHGRDYWPLPWYLRRFTQVGWYVDQIPEQIAAPIVVVAREHASALQAKLGDGYEAAGHYGLRPAVFLQLYVKRDLWERYLNRPLDPSAN